MAAPSRVKQTGPFADYPLGQAWDEMFAGSGEPRAHYQPLFRSILQLPPDELRRRKQAADLAFLHQGITFTVYGREEGTERMHFDVPENHRELVITAEALVYVEPAPVPDRLDEQDWNLLHPDLLPADAFEMLLPSTFAAFAAAGSTGNPHRNPAPRRPVVAGARAE